MGGENLWAGWGLCGAGGAGQVKEGRPRYVTTVAPSRDGIRTPVSDTRDAATCAREPNVGLGEAQGPVRHQCDPSSDCQSSGTSDASLTPWERYESAKRWARDTAQSPAHYERLISIIADEVGV